MDKDRIEGNVKEGFGKAQEAWGDVTNDPETQAEGEQTQAEGNLQEGWGKVKDAGRDLVDDDND